MRRRLLLSNRRIRTRILPQRHRRDVRRPGHEVVIDESNQLGEGVVVVPIAKSEANTDSLARVIFRPIPTRIGIPQRVVIHVAVGIQRLGVIQIRNGRIGRLKTPDHRVVHSAVHVDQTEVVEHVVIGEAVTRGARDGLPISRARCALPIRAAPRAEGIETGIQDRHAGAVGDCGTAAEVVLGLVIDGVIAVVGTANNHARRAELLLLTCRGRTVAYKLSNSIVDRPGLKSATRGKQRGTRTIPSLSAQLGRPE